MSLPDTSRKSTNWTMTLRRKTQYSLSKFQAGYKVLLLYKHRLFFFIIRPFPRRNHPSWIPYPHTLLVGKSCLSFKTQLSCEFLLQDFCKLASLQDRRNHTLPHTVSVLSQVCLVVMLNYLHFSWAIFSKSLRRRSISCLKMKLIPILQSCWKN